MAATEGSILALISKRLRTLRKKQNRITTMEEALSQGKTLNKDQEEILRSKPIITALIEELVNLRLPPPPPTPSTTEISLPAKNNKNQKERKEMAEENNVTAKSDIEAKTDIEDCKAADDLNSDEDSKDDASSSSCNGGVTPTAPGNGQSRKARRKRNAKKAQTSD